jgi:hypothetical protein
MKSAQLVRLTDRQRPDADNFYTYPAWRPEQFMPFLAPDLSWDSDFRIGNH